MARQRVQVTVSSVQCAATLSIQGRAVTPHMTLCASVSQAITETVQTLSVRSVESALSAGGRRQPVPVPVTLCVWPVHLTATAVYSPVSKAARVALSATGAMSLSFSNATLNKTPLASVSITCSR